MNIINPIIIILLSWLIVNCSGGKMEEKTTPFPSIKDVPASAWQKLAQKKIYFGHQSVGCNIIDGIKDLMKENPQIRLNIVESHDAADFAIPIFAHSRIGKNKDPKSKIDEFARFMEQGIGGKADISFFKFCYVDADAGNDIKKVFKDYNSTFLRLKKKYSNIIFIHITMPLTSVQTGPKAWIKKVIGRPVGGYNENIKRYEFNRLLRKEYEGQNPVFDLARIESTSPDRRRSLFTKDKKTYYSMVPNYTNDGGHLNEVGRKIAAGQLLIFLASLC